MIDSTVHHSLSGSPHAPSDGDRTFAAALPSLTDDKLHDRLVIVTAFMEDVARVNPCRVAWHREQIEAEITRRGRPIDS